MSRQGIVVPGVEPIRVQIGTFNCNLQGSSSVSPDLTHWLVPTISEKSAAYNTTSDQDGRTAPDLYAVGFQELLPLHDGFANNGAAYEAITKTDRSIRRAIRPQAALTRKDGMYPPGGGPEDYSLIASVHMVGIVLLVYARERAPDLKGRAGTGVVILPSVAERVKEIRTATVGTGLLGLMGNKGAAGARIVLGGAIDGQPDEVYTFVNAHLAAHDHKVLRRNRDWKNIVTRMVFTPESAHPLPTPLATNKATSDEKKLDGLTERYETSQKSKKNKAKALDSESYGVYETSHMFVFGDLNYRIGFNVSPSPTLARKGYEGDKLKKSDVKRKIFQEDWRTLATYDQLSTEHTSPSGPRVFHGLVEPDIRMVGYGPTYKYKVDKKARKTAEKAAKRKGDPDGVIDDTSSSNVGVLSGKRVPGWTDRILWASNGAQTVKTSGDLQGVHLELLRSIMRYTVSIIYLVISIIHANVHL
jgi:phosphatidylinositol-bisphosphatase